MLSSPCFKHHHQGSVVCTFLLARPWLHSSISFLVSACQWHICHLYLWLLLPEIFCCSHDISYFCCLCFILWLLEIFSCCMPWILMTVSNEEVCDFSILYFLAWMLVVFLLFSIAFPNSLRSFLSPLYELYSLHCFSFYYLVKHLFKMLPNFSFRTEVQMA